jgi:hypothetical protein
MAQSGSVMQNGRLTGSPPVKHILMLPNGVVFPGNCPEIQILGPWQQFDSGAIRPKYYINSIFTDKYEIMDRYEILDLA